MNWEDVLVDEDVDELKTLIENHLKHTGSTVAKLILDDWSAAIKQFVKVMPTDYKARFAGNGTAERSCVNTQLCFYFR